jgi:hypothetical protein
MRTYSAHTCVEKCVQTLCNGLLLFRKYKLIKYIFDLELYKKNLVDPQHTTSTNELGIICKVPTDII